MAKTKRRRKSKFRKWWKDCGTLTHILFVVAMFLLVFTVVMIGIFVLCGSVPDTLIASVFAACGFEGGICGWIKNVKEKKQERKWQIEDREEFKKGE